MLPGCVVGETEWEIIILCTLYFMHKSYTDNVLVTRRICVIWPTTSFRMDYSSLCCVLF